MGTIGALKGVVLTADSGEGDATGWRTGTGMLLPLANVPMIERILDAYERVGVKEALVAAGSDTGKVASLCGDGARWNMALTYLDTTKARSPNEIMKEVAAFTGEAVFLATHGPALLPAEAYLRAVQQYDENSLRDIRLWERKGEAPGDGHRRDGVYLLAADVRGFIDESDVAAGRTVSFGSILDALAGCGERAGSFDATPDALAARGDRVLDMAPEDDPYDTSTPEAYLESNERLLESTARALEPPESTGIMADNFSSPNLVLRPPVIVDDTAELERCRIGPGVCIGPGVRIGHGAAIEHSVIMAGADIGDGASISHAVIGRNASIANRSVVHGRADRVTVVCPISP